MKKIIAILVSLCLLLGAVSVMTVSAASYSGTPTMSDFSGTASGFYFDSMDGLTPPDDGTGGWQTNFFGVDGSAGVFLNGTKTTVPIRKVGTNVWYVCLDGTLALTANDIVTVKGTVAQATDSSVQVTLQETNFVYDGSKFSDYYHYTGTPYMHHNDSAAGFYFTAGDAAPYNNKWSTQWFAVSGKGSVTRNGSAISIDIRKVEPVGEQWYVVLSDYGVTPATGDVFTISGTFNCADNNERIRFEPMTVTWTGSEFRNDYTGTPTYKRDDGNGNGVYFRGGDSAPITGWGTNWDPVSGGIYKNGTLTTTAIRKVDTDEWYILLADFSQTAVAGDIITINGTFKYQTNYITFSEAQFIFNGSSWSAYSQSSVATGTSTTFDSSSSVAGFQIASNDGLTAPGWGTFFYAADGAENGFFVNGTKFNVHMQKHSSTLWYLDVSFANQTVNTGDIGVLKGLFVAENDSSKKVSFAEIQVQYNGTAWQLYVPDTTCYGTTTTLHSCNGTAGFYLTSDDGMTAPGWGTYFYAADGSDNGFFIDGTKYNVHMQKTDATTWYVDTNFGGVNATIGQKAIVKGLFVAENDSSKKVSLAEIQLVFTGSAWVDFTPVEVGASGVSYIDTRYNTSDWGVYFIVDGTLPGDSTTYFNNIVYEVNGTAYTALGFYGSADRLYIPIQNVPAVPTEEYSVVIKSGIYEGFTAGTNAKIGNGIYLTEDFAFTIGTTYTGGSPAVNYMEGTSNGGVHLVRTDDAPVTGWDAIGNLVPADENSGVYIDDVRNANIALRKYEDGKYYVCMSDAGVTAADGTVVTLKGTFTLNNLYYVTFPTSKYEYVDSAWKVYVSATVGETSTGIVGNANRDSAFDVCDAVVTIRYLGGSEDSICKIDADINGSGTVDRSDVRLIRRMLLGDLLYKGEPVYADDEEMRLAAYSGPRHSDGSAITDDDNGLFADYAAAGFTTLLSEHDGVYENAEFATYMQLAEQNDLDVLVFSGALVNMANGTNTTDAASIRSVYETASQYDSFRGFMLGDEPAITAAATWMGVTNVLKQLSADIDLFTSCHPLYAPDESVFTSDSSLSAAENYANYAKTYGGYLGDYTYDFYPFRSERSWKWSSLSYVTENKIRPAWYQNLETAATGANGNYTTGLTVQAYAEDANSSSHYRELSQADISYQVYNGLAYGMKSINYFTYTNHWALPDTTQCMIMDGVKQQLYYDVQSVNNEIKQFDHVMLKFNWQGTIGLAGDDEDGIMDYVGSYTSPRIASSSATNDAIIGCLKDQNGYDGFMLVNATDPIDGKSSTVTVKFNDADHAKLYINGVESVVALTDGTYTVTLKAGQGIFAIPYIA